MSDPFNFEDILKAAEDHGPKKVRAHMLSPARAKRIVPAWIRTEGWLYTEQGDSEEYKAILYAPKKRDQDSILIQCEFRLSFDEKYRLVYSVGETPILAMCQVEEMKKVEVVRVLPEKKFYMIRLKVTQVIDLTKTEFERNSNKTSSNAALPDPAQLLPQQAA